MNEQEFRELSAGHALHALTPDEEQAFSAALARHPEWRYIVDEDLGTAAALGATSGGIAPPPAARASILAAIADLPQGFDDQPQGVAGQSPDVADQSQAVADQPAREPGFVAPVAPGTRRRRGRAAWFALAASLAVLLAVSFTPWARDLVSPPDPITAALAQVEGAPDASIATASFAGGGTATLHWSDTEDQAVFVAEGLPAIDKQRDFELWIVRGETPISLGVVRASEGRDTAAIAKGFKPGDALAVTVEERGGSVSGAPTTDPIVVVASA